MNDFDIYSDEQVQILNDALKDLKRKYNAHYDKLAALSPDAPHRKELSDMLARINKAMIDMRRLLNEVIDLLRRIK